MSRSTTPCLQSAGAKLVEWCQTEALPFWATKAVDPNGGFYECIALDGTPIVDMPRRVRVQARLAYVFAHAAALGWYDGAEAASDRAFGQMKGPGFQSESPMRGCAHLLHPNGELADGTRDTYAQAFILLSGAWRAKAFGDQEAKKIAAETGAFLREELASDKGGFIEGLPASLPRRQNPHMHLFEAFMALYTHTDDQAWLDEATKLYELFKTVFWDEDKQVVREFFTEDWQIDQDKGGAIEPGHMMEWCWLLGEYQSITAANVEPLCKTLYHRAIDLGVPSSQPTSINGLLQDVVSLQDDAPAAPPTYRTWPQTEFLKASLTRARRGDEVAAENAARIAAKLYETYLDVPQRGGYRDQYLADGSPAAGHMQASTFYHLMSAAAEMAKYLDAQK